LKHTSSHKTIPNEYLVLYSLKMMMLLDSKGREDKKGEKGWAAAVGNLQIHGQCVMLSTKNFRSNP
jgi:hypothetical protein